MMKKKRKYMQAWASHAIAVLCAMVLVGGALWYAFPVHGEREIYDAVIRLHVIAASDSARDQADKLAVRDTVLELATEALEGCADRGEACARLEAALPALESAARRTLHGRGSDDAVEACLGSEQYPTRAYDGFCFPAGEYLSLRVMIGEAQGENFWCVLFPPMCMAAATLPGECAEEALVSVGLRPDQYGIITETTRTKYKLRFRILEWIEQLR